MGDALYQGLVGLTAALMVTVIIGTPVLIYKLMRAGWNRLRSKTKGTGGPQADVPDGANAPREGIAPQVEAREATRQPSVAARQATRAGAPLWIVILGLAACLAGGFGAGWMAGSGFKEQEFRAEQARLEEEARRRAERPDPPTPEQVAMVVLDGDSSYQAHSNWCTVPIWNGSDYTFNLSGMKMEWKIRHRSDGRIEYRVTEATLTSPHIGTLKPNEGGALISNKLRNSAAAVGYDVIGCRPAELGGVPYPHGRDSRE